MGQKGAGASGYPSSVGNPQYKLAPTGGNSSVSGNVSSLPPIVSAGQGNNSSMNQSKLIDPKTGRTTNQSSNQQKKRKKYKMNYAQQVSLPFISFSFLYTLN